MYAAEANPRECSDLLQIVKKSKNQGTKPAPVDLL